MFPTHPHLHTPNCFCFYRIWKCSPLIVCCVFTSYLSIEFFILSYYFQAKCLYKHCMPILVMYCWALSTWSLHKCCNYINLIDVIDVRQVCWSTLTLSRLLLLANRIHRRNLLWFSRLSSIWNSKSRQDWWLQLRALFWNWNHLTRMHLSLAIVFFF